MESFRPPLGLSLEGNLAENWRKFKQLFTIYLKASGNDKKDSEIKVAILLSAVGEDAVELYNTFDLSDEDRNKYESVLKCFEDYTTPKKNVVVERFIFNNRVQEPGETFDAFFTDLRKLVKSCDFNDQSDSVVRDRIVLGITDKGLQERLLREGDLSLIKAAEICRAAEISKIQAQAIQSKNIDFVRRETQFKNKATRSYDSSNENRESHFTNRPMRKYNSASSENTEIGNSLNSNIYMCKKCKRKHKAGECPAFGKQCHNCGLMNHFSAGCRVRNVREISYNDESQALIPSIDNVTKNEFFVGSIVVTKSIDKMSSSSEWIKSINVEGKEIEFKLDTGAQVNVLPLKTLTEISKNKKIKDTSIILEAYGGSKIKPVGTVILHCNNNNQTAIMEFVVIDIKNARPLLGLEGCMKFNLIKNVDNIIHNIVPKSKFVAENADIFEGVGRFAGKCKIKIKENATPVVKPPRRIPISLRPKLKEKLEKLEEQKIIVKVDSPESWVSNLVIVEKPDGSIRLCLDPQDLNKAVKREHVLIPTVEEILPKLCNKTVYTVLDLKDGFFQIELDDESTSLCTFSTPFGSYKFLRLPMGLSCAPEIFQKRNENNFGDIPGVLIYFDDLLIVGETMKQHDDILAQVVERARKLNIKFNKNKIQYRVSEVKYLGHVFSDAGMKPDPEQVKAITSMPDPTSKVELQRIMGMLNYLRRFIPNASAVSAPLRELLKQGVTWEWLPVHKKTFEVLKSSIVNAPVLGVFDSTKPIVLQADSSKDGLGCCMLQNGQPIAFASRSLTETEKGYAQIEKEFLSIVFATTKFHYYIYGREVEVLTDHKPLVSIMNKNVTNIVSNRLQRMKIKLLKYNLNLKYLPGKFMYIADLLSRSFLKEEVSDDQEMKEIVHSLTKQLQMSNLKKRMFEVETSKDSGLMAVMKYWSEGWPTVQNVTVQARDYFKHKNEISVEGGLVFLNDRVIVPQTLRKDMLKLLHEAHSGIEKSKARARQVIFWPGINKDIEKMISTCSSCERYRHNNVKEPLINQTIPELPYEKVGADILEFGGRNFLVVSCYLTKWIDLVQLKSKSSDDVIIKFKSIFSTHGIPKTLRCDNMPFASKKMSDFAKDWGFEIITSSPHYPKSNGFAEKMVGIAKNILRKCGMEAEKIYEALLQHRNTPISGTNVSPSQLLMSRSVRTKLPVSKIALQPKVNTEFRHQLEKKQIKNKLYYDKHAQIRPEFTAGENVVTRVGNHWEQAKIMEKHRAPRSYLVKMSNGHILRRNKYHIRKSNNKFQDQSYNWGPYGERNREENDSNITVNTNMHSQTNCNNTSNCHNAYMTRSGRHVQQPSRFRDYVL